MAQIISFAAARTRLADNDKITRSTVVKAFLTDLQSDGRSSSTIVGHRNELRRYGQYLDETEQDWQTITPAALNIYARTRADNGVSSRTSLVITMRVFYGWASDPGQGPLVARNPAERLKTPKRPKATPRSLNAEQVRQLLAALDREAEKDASLRMQRDRVLLLTALYTGARAAELAGLYWPDLDLISGVAVVRKGKGAKGRAMKLRPEVCTLLSAWRVLQAGSPDAPVFSLGADPLVPNRVGKIVRRYARLTRLPLTAHVLRHTFATTALRRSGNLYSVSKALGHAQLQQTMVYVRGDPRDSESAIDSLPGIDDW